MAGSMDYMMGTEDYKNKESIVSHSLCREAQSTLYDGDQRPKYLAQVKKRLHSENHSKTIVRTVTSRS